MQPEGEIRCRSRGNQEVKESQELNFEHLQEKGEEEGDISFYLITFCTP